MPQHKNETASEALSNWLSQFDRFDRPIAQSLVDDLNLVSTSQFEIHISKTIRRILKNYKKIALYPVLELAEENLSAVQDDKKEKVLSQHPKLRRLAGSSTKISYFISRLHQQYPRSIAARPTHENLISEKIKAIVYIDDFIGSGQQIINFWHFFVSRKIKSWLSYSKCDVFFVSYAAMSKGISNIVKNCRGVKKDEFLFFIKDPSFKDKKSIISLCDRYISKFSKNNIYGYGNTLTNIVFEWKCPNNTPPLLWSDKNWTPLFKGRNINQELFFWLSSQENVKRAAQIWDSGQFKVALGLLDNFHRLSQSDIDFVSLLSFYAKRVSVQKIKSRLKLSDEEMNQLIAKAENCRAIEHGKISDFGLALLESFRRLTLRQQRSSLFVGDGLYLPRQYKGILSNLA